MEHITNFNHYLIIHNLNTEKQKQLLELELLKALLVPIYFRYLTI